MAKTTSVNENKSEYVTIYQCPPRNISSKGYL